MPTTVRPGRRMRNMRDKQNRIFAAAEALFAEHGFAEVTVAQIADAADVAAGTLFRYAASKPELLLMVYNRQFGAAIADGRSAAEAAESPADAVFTLVAAVLDAGAVHPENSVAYQRELLFGSPAERYRAEGLTLVAELEDTIATRLVASIPQPTEPVRRSAERAARSVFAVLHLFLARPATGFGGPDDQAGRDELRRQIAEIVLGFQTANSGHTDT